MTTTFGSAPTQTTAPAVWIGCLACYNAGRLVGDWFPAETAEDVTLEAVHAAGRAPVRDCEELWVMDHEGFGGLLKGECSPMEATRLASMIDAIEASTVPLPAFAAWRDNYDATAEVDEELIELAREAFCGTWADVEDYVWDFLDEQLEALPEWVHTHRGAIVRSYARDLEAGGDLWTDPTPDSGVYVFRSV